MSPFSRSAWKKSVCLAACLAACADEKGVPLQLTLGNLPASDTCDTGTSQLTTVAPKTVRVTVVQKTGPTDPGKFVCDRIITLPDHPTFRVAMPTAQIDLYAEAFTDADPADPNITRAGKTRRVASGVTYGIDSKTKMSQGVRLYRAEDFSCTPADGGNGPGLQTARAFHSATALPNRQVLIIGGVVANPTDNTRVSFVDTNYMPLYTTGTIEIYDADAGKLTLANDAAPVARAFHSAVLLTQVPPYQILLLGGFASTDATKPIMEANDGSQGGFRFVPIDLAGSSIKPPLPTKAVAPEILTYDPVTQTVTHAPLALLPTAALSAVGNTPQSTTIALGGGIDYNAGAVDATHARDLISGNSNFRVGMLAAPHAAGALAMVNDAVGVLWGGAIDNTGNVGELLTGLGGTGIATALTSTAPLVEFPTATLVTSDAMAGTGTVLVTGGFAVDSLKRAMQPSPGYAGLQIVSISGTTATVAPAVVASGYANDCTSDNRYRPAGWESAVALGNGRVLVTGGAPSTDVTCNNCELGGTKATCATRQTSVYENGQLAPATKKLGFARAGHTSTLIDDGTVLIAGGLTLTAANGPSMVRALELYNPRHVTPPVMQPTDSDPDDPVAALFSAGVTRVAGQVAQFNGKPYSTCPDL